MRNENCQNDQNRCKQTDAIISTENIGPTPYKAERWCQSKTCVIRHLYKGHCVSNNLTGTSKEKQKEYNEDFKTKIKSSIEKNLGQKYLREY